MLFLFFPIADHHAVRVQPLERAELAAGRAFHQVVLLDVAQPGSAGRAVAVAAGGADRHRRSPSCWGRWRPLRSHRFRFFGREAVSLLLVLPLALPGIITGMALNSFINFTALTFALMTIVIGHATFCIVAVYNNALARLRRTPTSLLEASMDLGANGWQTFRHVTLPTIATALVAGGLLAFALSFDEIVVTTFTAGAQNTLPIWIYGNIRNGQQLPQVNVVVLFVIIVSVIPVTLAQRLTRTRASCAGSRSRPARRRSPVPRPAAAGRGKKRGARRPPAFGLLTG